MNGKNIKKLLSYLFFTALAVVLLYFSFRETEWGKLKEDFAHAHWGYVILSFIMGLYAFVARGLRWELLLNSMDYQLKSKASAIHSVSLGYFSNMLIPRSGELFRCTALYRMEKIPVNKLFGTVILERVIDFAFLLILFTLGFFVNLQLMIGFFEQDFFNNNQEESNFSIWILAGVALLLLLALMIYLFRRRITTLPIYTKIRDFIRGLIDGFRSISMLTPKQKRLFWWYSVQIWLMYFLMIWIVFYALDATSHLNMADGLFIMIIGGLGMVIPTPGGIGSFHYLVMTGLSFLGIHQSDGLSFATITHATQALMTIMAGLTGLVYLYTRNKTKNHEQHTSDSNQ